MPELPDVRVRREYLHAMSLRRVTEPTFPGADRVPRQLSGRTPFFCPGRQGRTP